MLKKSFLSQNFNGIKLANNKIPKYFNNTFVIFVKILHYYQCF